MTKTALINHRDNDDFLELLRQDKVPQGEGIGCLLDNNLRFKRGKLNMILGHANVGKTYWVLFYLLCLSRSYGHKHLIYSAENSVNGLKRNLLELYSNKKVTTMTAIQLEEAKSFIETHFDFIDVKRLWTIDEFMKDVQNLGKYDTLLIDPLNSFQLPRGMNAHVHDYEALAKLRLYAKKFDTTVYICMHASSEALRKTHKSGDYEGLPIPPNAADAEGGGKHVNRCDDFIVLHRYTQSPNSWMYTEVHIKKIKETETGGKPTFLAEPILFKLEYGTAFTCAGVNPLEKNPAPLKNNINFG